MVTTRSSSRRSPCTARSVSADFERSVDSYVSSSEAPSVSGTSLTASTDAAISAKGSPSSEAAMNISISLTLSTEGDSVGSGDERSEADTSADGNVSSGNGPTLHTSSVSSYNADSAATSGDGTCEAETSVDRVVSDSCEGIQVMAGLMLTLNSSTLSIFYRFWMGPLSMRRQPLRFSLPEFEQLTETLLGPHKNFTIKQIVKLLKSDREMLGWKKLRLMVRNLDFFFSYPWGHHSFERTLRMIKVGKKVRRQSDITKKLKQRSLYVPGGEDVQDFLVRGIDILPKLKTFHTDNILAVENDDASSCDPSYTNLLPQKEFTYSRCKAIPQTTRLGD
ncbi:unnamed protein product [Arabidopsis halleri]